MPSKPLDASRRDNSYSGFGIPIGRPVAWEINSPIADTECQSSCIYFCFMWLSWQKRIFANFFVRGAHETYMSLYLFLCICFFPFDEIVFGSRDRSHKKVRQIKLIPRLCKTMFCFFLSLGVPLQLLSRAESARASWLVALLASQSYSWVFHWALDRIWSRRPHVIGSLAKSS